MYGHNFTKERIYTQVDGRIRNIVIYYLLGRVYELAKVVCYAMSVSLCVLRFELTGDDSQVQPQTLTNWGRYTYTHVIYVGI